MRHVDIPSLLTELEKAKAESAERLRTIEARLEKAFHDQYKDWSSLAQALVELDAAKNFGADENGIYAWVRFACLANLLDVERTYLESYLFDHCVYVDWEHDALITHLGDDVILVQDDTRHDNGVYQCGKLIIEESAYRDEDTGEVDESRRNELIEAHMERTGCFSDVFRLTQRGDVFPIQTQKK